MTKQNKLNKLRSAIISEIPELDISYMGENYEHVIRLSDVLSIVEMMYEDDEDEKTIPTSEIPQIKEVLNMWEFSKGSLENQSEYTICLLLDLILKEDEKRNNKTI